jgi:hypothetical protein
MIRVNRLIHHYEIRVIEIQGKGEKCHSVFFSTHLYLSSSRTFCHILGEAHCYDSSEVYREHLATSFRAAWQYVGERNKN